MDLTIGVTLGDPTGVGPEVTLKALRRIGPQAGVRFELIGDADLAARWNQRLGLRLSWGCADDPKGWLVLRQPGSDALPSELTPGDPVAARAALAWLTCGAEAASEGRIHALVTGPVNKAAIIRSGAAFIGQTEWVAAIARTTRYAMMLLGPDDAGRWLRVALVTIHLPLRRVPDAITTAGVRQTIELAHQACLDLGLARRRVGVCGLNPHAGEEGCLGAEDMEQIAPAVEAARGLGIEAVGPLPADTLFHQAYRGDFDAVVAMYHDQGLGPLKMAAFDRGVNWTLGLPFPRLSPDHGTAYDIAGRGVANEASMEQAIRMAAELARRRRGPPPA